MKYLPFVLSVFAFTLTACDDQNNESNQTKAENPAAANTPATEDKAQPANKKQDAVGQNVKKDIPGGSGRSVENTGQDNSSHNPKPKTKEEELIKSAKIIASQVGAVTLGTIATNLFTDGSLGVLGALGSSVQAFTNPAYMNPFYRSALYITFGGQFVGYMAGKCVKKGSEFCDWAGTWIERYQKGPHAETLVELCKSPANDFRKSIGEGAKEIAFESNIKFQELVLRLEIEKDETVRKTLVKAYMLGEQDLRKFMIESEENIDAVIETFLKERQGKDEAEEGPSPSSDATN